MAAGTVDNLACFRIVNTMTQSMAHMFGNATDIANFFSRIGGKARFDGLMINLLSKVEAKQHTDVNSNSRESGQWNIFNVVTPCVIQEIGHVA